MPMEVRILERANVVYVRHVGRVTAKMLHEGMAGYLAHPAFRPRQHHLVDLSRLELFDVDWPDYLAFFAKMTSTVPSGIDTPMLGIYAPTDLSRRLAQRCYSSWDGTGRMNVRIQDTEERLLRLLGLPGETFEALLASDRVHVLEP